MKVCIFDIKRFAVHDGPGIRTTVFFKGCPLSCQWCHNPEGISGDIEYFREVHVLDGVDIHRDVQIGRWIGLEDLMEELVLDKVFMEESGGGISFSGGEPLHQKDALFSLLEMSMKQDLHTAVDTSGFATSESIRELSMQCDLILYDLKSLNDRKHREFTGVSNRLILENLKLAVMGRADVIVRIPFIKGFNDLDEEVISMLDFLLSLEGVVKQVDLLPYHRFGVQKYIRFKKELYQEGFTAPEKDRMEQIENRFVDSGFTVALGG